MARTEITETPISSGDPAQTATQPKILSRPRAALKRAVDIVGAVIGIPLFAPLMALTAILVKLDSAGPVFFMQMRAGVNGKVFKIYKFRTMVANAEKLLDEMIDVAALEEPMFKLQNDPRVTPLGRFLRRWSIDELPQLYNVLKGEMSLVGPRPEEARLALRYNHWHRLRLLAKPGMTGPMQINGRGDLPLETRVHLEVDYIQNYSIWKDIAILLKTAPAVIKGTGGY